MNPTPETSSDAAQSRVELHRFVRPALGGSVECSDLSEPKRDMLLARFCGKHTAELWGQPFKAEPVLLQKQWGDGCQIVALRPIAVRRSWYVIAIDSLMELGSDEWRDLLDSDIYEELEDQFGRVCKEDQENEEFDCHAAWPMVNHDYGHEWWWIGTLPNTNLSDAPKKEGGTDE